MSLKSCLTHAFNLSELVFSEYLNWLVEVNNKSLKLTHSEHLTLFAENMKNNQRNCKHLGPADFGKKDILTCWLWYHIYQTDKR